MKTSSSIHRMTAPLLFTAALLFALIGFAGVRAGAADQADAPASAPSVQYTITDLGGLPSIADDVAPGLSQSGLVSLWTRSSDGAVHAQVWNHGQAADLGIPAGYANSIARAVNDRGDVVGWVV
jgi:uncharacterized membrane protein